MTLNFMKKILAPTRGEVRALERRVALRDAKIARLECQLNRERQYSRMLSLLQFAAVQCPERLRQVKRAATLRKNAKPRKMRKEEQAA